MAQAASNARTSAAATLKASMRDLTRYKDGTNPSKRLLQNKYDKALADKDDLRMKHYTYAEKASLDLESDELLEWINERMDEASDLLDEVFLILDKFTTDELETQRISEKALEDTKVQKDIAVAELQCASDERALRERLEAMNTYVSEETHNSKEHADRARTYLTEVEECLGQLIKSWNVLKYLPSVSEDQLNRAFQTEEELKKLVSEERLVVISFINKLDPDNSIEIKSTSGSSEAGGRDFDSNQLKSERIKNPKFSGDIRSLFANFKSDFEKIVASKYSDKVHQSYVIKQSCLVGEAKKLVENMNDIDKIWERLESRYGDTQEIVHIIVQGVEKFKFIRNQHDQGIIDLVDQLEKGVQDLEAIKSKHEIANAHRVNILEKK